MCCLRMTSVAPWATSRRGAFHCVRYCCFGAGGGGRLDRMSAAGWGSSSYAVPSGLLGRSEPILTTGDEPWAFYTSICGIDVAKVRNAIAVADGERGGEVRYIGEVDASDDSMRRAVKSRLRRSMRGAVLLRSRSDRLWPPSPDKVARI